MIKTQTDESTTGSSIRAEYLDGEPGFARFREDTADIAEVTFRDAPDAFQAHSTTRHLGSAVTVDVTSSPVIFDHTTSHIARTRADHYMVTMYVSGGCEFAAGRRTLTARAGDLFIVDYVEPNRSHVFGSNGGSARVLNLVLPRHQLAPLLAAPDAVQASLIPGASTAGTLLGEHLLALNQPVTGLAPGPTERQLAELIQLLTQSIGPGTVSDPRLARQALLSTIKRHVNRHLDGEIHVSGLCQRFGLSRSALYRLFEPEGGIAAYIQQQRLIRAFALLVAPQTGKQRVIDIALNTHFASDATFARAFRRQFGCTPGEVRMLIKRTAAPSRSATDARWIQELARSGAGNP